MNLTIETIVFSLIGLILGILIYHIITIRKQKTAKNSSDDIIEQAKKEAERIKKNANFKARDELQVAQNKIKQERRNKEVEIQNIEKRLLQEEVKLKSQISDYSDKEKELFEKRKQK